MRRNYGNNLAYIDILFNTLVGFVMLFIIAFLLINPITKDGDIPSKAEWMITLEWDNKSPDDIDVWIWPEGYDKPISFQSTDVGFWHLDRDDLGISNDYVLIDGGAILLQYNREIATMRGVFPGDVYINVHVYGKKRDEPTNFTVTYSDINPVYTEVYRYEGVAQTQGQVFALPGLRIDSEGQLDGLFASDKIFAAKRDQLPPPGGVGGYAIP